MSLSKADIRKQFRAQRRAVSLADRMAAAQQAVHLFSQQAHLQAASHIGCYLPTAEEFDANPLIAWLWQQKKSCYLPVVSNNADKSLTFLRYERNDLLTENRYHILEPQPDKESITPQQLDLVFLPIIAFDLKGHRLGSGSGYYDKTFSFLKEQKATKPLLIGLAYAFQLYDPLPHDPWDIALDGVLTEKEFFSLRQS